MTRRRSRPPGCSTGNGTASASPSRSARELLHGDQAFFSACIRCSSRARASSSTARRAGELYGQPVRRMPRGVRSPSPSFAPSSTLHSHPLRAQRHATTCPATALRAGLFPCAAAGKSRGFKDRKVVAPVEPSTRAPASASAPLSRRHGSRVDRASSELSGSGAGHAPGRASRGPRCERRRPSPRPPVRTAAAR
jgi:hypothetical protein